MLPNCDNSGAGQMALWPICTTLNHASSTCTWHVGFLCHAALIAAKSVAQMEEEVTAKDGRAVKRYVVKTLKPGTGTLSQLEYDTAVIDLVNYMTYMAEPARLERRQIGFYALMLLGLLFVLVYALKKSYWKDVH